MAVNYQIYAKKMIKIFVSRILDEKISPKYLTYGEIAEMIDFPKPYTGNNFSREIGMVLGSVGDLLASISVGTPIPIIQTLAVAKSTKLPSYGLRAFVPGYDSLVNNEKKAFAQREYDKIKIFGENWLEVLKKLNIDYSPSKTKTQKRGRKYNPFGSEGSPEHINVKNYIKEHHNKIGYKGTSKGIDEYPLYSGDKIDVVFRDETGIYAYEAKSIRSDEDDIQRGIFQCVKYKKILEAQNKVFPDMKFNKIFCALVIETKMPTKLEKICEKLSVTYYEVKVNNLL